MQFDPKDVMAYRAMNADQYEERRSLVLSLAEALPVDATEEQMRSIDAEMDIIREEDTRRDKMTELRNHKAVEVIAGAGKVVESTKSEASERKSAETLGDHFVEYVQKRGHEKSFHLVAPAYKRAATDFHATTPIIEYDRNVIVPPAHIDVIGLFNREVISGNTISYFVQGNMEGTPAVTAEGGLKPQVHFPSEPKTAALKKIAGIIKESDELIDDAPFLVSAINGRLVNELNLVRQATIVADLLGTSGIGTADTSTSADASDIADAIDLAMMNVVEDTGFDADGIIMTPALWHALNVGKNDNSDYYGDGYFRAPMARSLWGIPVALASTLTANHIVVGAFKTCASLVGKAEGVTVESTNTDADDFQRNLMTLRAEVREVIAVRRPAGFIDITVK